MSTQIIHTNFRSFDATDINLMLDTLLVHDSGNQASYEKQLITLEAFKEFVLKFIDIESMPTREAKASYIRFLSKITENIESLEILTGKVTIEEIKAAGKSFARKTQFAVGIYD